MMELRQIQITQIELLKEVNRICKANNINYFLIDGSALGAYNINKMLPWDDDIDVGMYIDDYIKFIHCCSSDDERFLMKDCITVDEFGCSFGQFIDKTTPVSQKNNCTSNDVKGVFIDIHPFVDDSRFVVYRFIHYYVFKFFKHILLIHRNYTISLGFKYKMLCILSKIIDEKLVLKYIQRRRVKKYKSDIAVKIHGRHFNDYIFKSNLKKLCIVSFEGIDVPIMPDAKRMLDTIYGEFDLNKNEYNRHEFIYDEDENKGK